MHEGPELRKDFEIVNRVLGWGNPHAPIWFIGLEEAGEWGKDVSTDKETLEKYENCFNGWMPVEPGQIQKDAEEKRQEFTQVYEIMSKLVLEVMGGKLVDWPDYLNKKLFVDEIVCQSNLYPLGKKIHKGELPEVYKTLLGFGPKDGERLAVCVCMCVWRGQITASKGQITASDEKQPCQREQWAAVLERPSGPALPFPAQAAASVFPTMAPHTHTISILPVLFFQAALHWWTLWRTPAPTTCGSGSCGTKRYGPCVPPCCCAASC